MAIKLKLWIPVIFTTIVAAFSISWLTKRTESIKVPLSEWGQAIAEIRQQLSQDESLRKNEEKLQSIIENFSRNYPVLVDWLHQDKMGDWQQAIWSDDLSADHIMVEKVLDDIVKMNGSTKELQRAITLALGQNNQEDLLSLYLQACEQRRALRLSHLLAKGSPIVFAQHHNFKMSFIGYTEGLSDARHERFFKPGSKLTQLSFNGLYATAEPLIDDPYGMIRDVDVSDDGQKILFAWKKSDRLDDYHIYEYHLETKEIKQLTDGIGRADYEPVYLPDGDIIFASTRPEQSVPCWWTEISNLYRMSADGQYIRRLAIDQVHTLYPQVLENGKIIYTRWDYSDRGQNYPHPLFNMNPDGTDQRVYYGGNSWFPTSLLHARTIPGTDQVMAIAAGHHTRQHGKLVVLNVEEGRDEGKGMHFVAPQREVPYERVDVAQQTGDQFRYPYPLNSHEFLVSYVPEKPGAEYPKYGDNAVYGLYWMNLDGQRELLFSDPELSVGRPVPLHKPTNPLVIPDTVDYQQNTGLYYVHDVYEGVGLKGIERGTAKKIRVVRLNYRAAGVGQSRNEGEGGGSLNSNPISIGNGAWDIKEILGDVDIEEDGSALFEVPAMQSIYLQVLDKKGRVIQNTRSWDTVRPGEKKACLGCHAKENANYYDFKAENTLAWKDQPQRLQPFYGETRGFSFIQEIQPLLDRHCVSCHDGSREGVMSLKGDMKSHGTLEKRTWSESYLNLTHAQKQTRKDDSFYTGIPENEVVNWISKMSKPTELDPYSFGAATSKMMHMLEEGHYQVSLSEEEYHKLAAWLDLLVPFVGQYREANDWTDKEMAYYNYYEYKRGIHKAEETEAIKSWIRHKETGQVLKTSRHQQPQASKGYRTLDGDLRRMNDLWSLNFTEEVIIDRLELIFSEVIDELKISLTYANGKTEDFELNLKSSQGVLVLPIPRNSNQITLKILPDQSLVKVNVFGVSLSELPSFESHHPYLQLGD